MKLSIFSAKSKTTAIVRISTSAKKKVPRNFLII